MWKFRKMPASDPLIVSMAGLRPGERVLLLGCAKPKNVAILALKPGLTGVAVAVDEDPARTAAAAEAARREGALLDVETASYSALPFEPDSFDAVVAGHLLGGLDPLHRVKALEEAVRVLRPGGRCIVIDGSGGLGGLFGGKTLKAAEAERALSDADLRGVRTLAQREGLLFVEGAKAGTALQ